jgi:ABC-type branched-subunit amino acid transport system ATPase component/branched-subunit amino acid ABC-type transport system permease component
MNWIQFAVLGLGSGAAYALLAQGIVLIYRGSGVVNFAHGAIAMAGAYLYAEEFRARDGWSVAPALIAATAIAAVLGALIHLLVMRPLRKAAPLTRVIATLGVLLVLNAAATLRYGGQLVTVGNFLPQGVLNAKGSVTVPEDRLWLLGLALAVTAALWAVGRYTRFGLATGAAAENQRAASSLGWSPDLLAAVNWAVGAALAALAGIIVSAYSGLQVATLTLIVIVALAAALFGDFSSYPLVLLGGLGIGVVRSEIVGVVDAQYWHQQGLEDAVPFVIIAAVLVVRGRGLPLRGTVVDRLPNLGPGRVRLWALAPSALLFGFLALAVFSQDTDQKLTVSLVAATVLLSVVVLTGYTGQLSLAQSAIGGMGAWFAAALVADRHWPFLAALLVGTAGAAAAGAVFALPALRTRGVNLAVITLGMGLALQSMLFDNSGYTGGDTGFAVGPQRILGFDIDPQLHPSHYTIFALAVFLLAALVTCNVRRGRAGRRLIAVRANERAATSLGISVVGAKMYGFVLSAAIAGVGGIVLAFQAPYVSFATGYDPLSSITAVALAVVGGVGHVAGPLFGSTLQDGGVGTLISDALGGIEPWIPLIGGGVLIILLITHPDGIASVAARNLRPLLRLAASIRPRTAPPAAPQAAERERARPAVLDVRGLTVHFGGVVALHDVSLTVHPGEVVGLMGPNGAGKTTFIDAVTGFVRPRAGTVTLDEQRLDRLPAYRRVRAGLSRSFQSLELFDDVSVRDNLRAACDPRDLRSYLTGLLWSRDRPLPARVHAAVADLGLGEVLDRAPGELPYGKRRLAAIARAIATGPSVLLLDEPGAGLDEHETAELGRVVRRLAADWGIGVLLIEHDVRMLMDTSDRVVVLDFGRKIAEGVPAQIRRDELVRAAYLGDADPDDEAEYAAS